MYSGEALKCHSFVYHAMMQVDSLCSARGDSESEAARRIKTQLMVEIQVRMMWPD